jgi:glycerate-2-kinase
MTVECRTAGDPALSRRETALEIFRAALAAVEPRRTTARTLAGIGGTLSDGPVTLIAFGKAAGGMAAGAHDALGERIARGIAIMPHGSPSPPLPPRIVVRRGGHPSPDGDGMSATLEALEMASRAGRDDLVLCLVSGGGSSLLVAPCPGVSLDDKVIVTRTLQRAGTPIDELNTVRKHLSMVKGGRLARAAFPARLAALAVSDVIGDRPEVIASGPTVADPGTFEDALQVIRRAGVAATIPRSVIRHLRRGASGLEEETVKAGDSLLRETSFVLAASSGDALGAGLAWAEAAGCPGERLPDAVQGEARSIGRRLAGLALRRQAELGPGRRLCILSGGETTVTVTGSGTGGRNQELALAFALEIAGHPGITLLSAGTDGIDGPTDAAGALVDGDTVYRALAHGLNPARALANNDSHPLLDAAGCLLRTGPTGTNVMDLQVMVVDPPGSRA